MKTFFSPGDWAIDTQYEIVVTIMGELGGEFIEQLYAVRDDETSKIYIRAESNLQKYK